MIAGREKAAVSPSPGARRGGEQGYVLLVFIFFAALLFVGLGAMLRTASFEGRRQREEELIFRGLQYQHALQLYFRKFGRYPSSLDDLEKSNGIRFLRKRYKDPMTKEGEWRLVHIGPGGVFVDSQTQTQPATAAGAPASGGNPFQPGSGQSSGQNPNQGPNQIPGQSPGQPSPFGISPSGQLTQPGAGGNSPNDPAFVPSANPSANPSQRARVEGQPAGGAPQAAGSPQPGNPSPIFGGGAIAGFASLSKDESIKTWNGFSEYAKWEFIYDYRQDPMAVAALQRLTGQQQVQPTPQIPGQVPTPNPGQPQPPNPFGNPPGSINFPGAPNQPRQPGFPPSPSGPGTPINPFPGFLPPPQAR